MHELNPDDLALLDFEAEWTGCRYEGEKESAARTVLGLGLTAYYARLDRLIDQPAAWAYAPTLVKRLRRIRDAKKAARKRAG